MATVTYRTLYSCIGCSYWQPSCSNG